MNGNDCIKIKSSLYDYEVEFVKDFTDVLQGLGEKCVYVIDKNVYGLYKDQFTVVPEDRIYLMEPVESKKNMETVMEIIGFWSSLSVQKSWKVVCFGGGITQDVTTVAANLFLRNVDWFFFPTTLLSMCDSCIGGKCGINLGEVKNQLGVFYPPKKIFIDTHFINTLTHGDYLNGWGEILKFSLTNYADFYEELKSEKSYIPCDNIEYYVKRGLEVKKEVIEADEFESDYRRVLNYGHTFGHALEAYTHNEIPHGQGVIWGIDVANYIAYKEGLIDEAYYLEIKETIKTCFLTDEIVVDDPLRLFEMIKKDKKVRNDTLYFALLDGKSHLCVHPVKIGQKLENVFMDYLRSTNEYYNN